MLFTELLLLLIILMLSLRFSSLPFSIGTLALDPAVDGQARCDRGSCDAQRDHRQEACVQLWRHRTSDEQHRHEHEAELPELAQPDRDLRRPLQPPDTREARAGSAGMTC